MIEELNSVFVEIIEFAERNQICLRKAVGCAALVFDRDGERLLPIAMEHNGPSRPGYKCTNEVGNCGCSHSEPRVVQSVIEENLDNPKLVMVCTYSPCTTCANIIIDSGLFGLVVYDILTQHDTRGEKFLRGAMGVISKEELNTLTEREASDKIKTWLSR